jgi:methionine synthase reductase
MYVLTFLQAKDTFAGLPYATLGLGDTNYDKYCHMGKSIDKRLSELGGQRLLELHCADEGTGTMEETIEAWKRSVLKAAKQLHAESLSAISKNNSGSSSEGGGSGGGAGQQAVDEEKFGDDGSRKTLGSTGGSSGRIHSSSSCTSISTAAEVDLRCTQSSSSYIHDTVPAGIQTLQQVAALKSVPAEQLLVAPTAAQLPRLKASQESSCPFQLLDYDRPDGTEEDDEEELPQQQGRRSATSTSTSEASAAAAAVAALDGSQWTAESPFHASIMSAQWLTKAPGAQQQAAWGEDRCVVSLQLSLAGSHIAYSPGDSIGVCCPNAPYAVEIVLQRLREAHPELPSLSLRSAVRCPGGGGEGGETSLGELLAYKFDLMGQPKKASMLTLAQCCTDPQEAILLQHLCSKGEPGKTLWTNFVEMQALGVAEVMLAFPSCRPRLYQLLACLTPLPPRYYSICSSPLVNPRSVKIAFSVVRHTCNVAPSDIVIERAGLCSTYLEKLAMPWLLPSAGKGAKAAVRSNASNSADARDTASGGSMGVKVRIFPKVSINFHLPGCVAPPLLLIGPGTGVAPFMGFLEHRAQLERERRRAGGEDDACTGMWRGGFELEEEDLPAECGGVEKFIHNKEPGPIYLFFGCRNDDDYLFKSELRESLCTRTLTDLDVAMSRVGPEKVYVTHKLKQRGAEVARLILEDGAHVYICGDGNHMAKDVFGTMRALLCEHGSLSEQEADALLQDMKLRRKYILDIWS